MAKINLNYIAEILRIVAALLAGLAGGAVA